MMSIVDINTDKHITVWRYSLSEIYDLASACEWISNAADIPYFEVDYITLKDLTNRNDEGNTSSQLSGNVSPSELHNTIQKADIDIVSITGMYKGELLVIGVDLRSKIASVTLKNASANLIGEIQNSLHL